MSFKLPAPGQEKLIRSTDGFWLTGTPNEVDPLTPVPEEDEEQGKVEVKEEQKKVAEKPKLKPENLGNKV